MAKLGFKPGQALGKRASPSPSSSTPNADATATAPAGEKGDGVSGEEQPRGRIEPLNLVFKENRGGIGLDSEKKRKFREEAEEAVKKVKQEEGDYRDRVREEREMRRAEAQFRAAQKVAERLDAEADGEGVASEGEKEGQETEGNANSDEPTEDEAKKSPKNKNVKPTSQINILYRGLVREREEKERSIQARHYLQTSLPSSFFPQPRLPSYDDPALDADDKHAVDTGPDLSSILEQEVEEEDPELDEFNELEPSERLARIVQWLREQHRYCFWCKYRYETDEMEGCPGVTEEDHD